MGELVTRPRGHADSRTATHPQAYESKAGISSHNQKTPQMAPTSPDLATWIAAAARWRDPSLLIDPATPGVQIPPVRSRVLNGRLQIAFSAIANLRSNGHAVEFDTPAGHASVPLLAVVGCYDADTGEGMFRDTTLMRPAQ